MSERLVRIRELFLAAVELDPMGRDQLLDEAKDGGHTVETVRGLLAAHDRRGPMDELGALFRVDADDRRRLGQSFGERYRVIRELGRGGMGVVELAHDRLLDRLVAVKRLDLPDDRPALHAMRLVQEARAAARLDHPLIATVYSVETDDAGRPVLCMEYCPGESLADRLKRQAVGRDEAIRLAADVAKALAAAHAEGIVHRDIKPSNVLLIDDGSVRLVDFGIARAGPSSRRRVAGTTGYVAPEQAAGADVDGRADLWSLGVVLHEMLSGRPPEAGRHPRPEEAVDPSTDPFLASVLERLLTVDPANRHQDAMSLVKELEGLLPDAAGWRPEALGYVPATLDRFVGREALLGRIVEAMSESRLVTVVGPGGVGKTRCALEIARRRVDAVPELVTFVPLASVRDPDRVLPAIASALGVRVHSPGSIVDTIGAAIGDTEILVIIDNFEHVSDAAEQVLRLLERCPELRALVTSRTALGVHGEHVVRLDPLRCKSPDEPVGLSQAAELFVTKASSALPTEGLDEPLLQRVEAICHSVDGLPLGIELAAGAARTYSLDEVAEALADLRDGPVDRATGRPDRHRSLRATVRWSFELLNDDLRDTFLAVSIFRTPFSVSDAAFVRRRDEADLEDHLERLVDRSLLQRSVDRDEGMLYSFLETIREFAEVERSLRSEDPRLAHLHLERFAAVAANARESLQGPEQVKWLDRLERSAPDLDSALRWSTEGGDPERGAALMLDGWRYWLSRGRSDDGARLVQKILDAWIDPPPGPRAKLLEVLASFERNIGRSESALDHLEESLALLRRAGDRSDFARLLNQLSWTHILGSRLEHGERYAREALDVFLQEQSARGEAVARTNLGWIACIRGRGDEAFEHHSRNLSIVAEAGDQRAIVYGSTNLSWALVVRGQYDEALSTIEEARDRMRDVRDPLMEGWRLTIHGLALGRVGREEESIDALERSVEVGKRFEVGAPLAWSLAWLGEIQRVSGRLAAAETSVRSGLDAAQSLRNLWGIALCRTELGSLALERGERVEADAHLTEAVGLWTELGNDTERARCEDRLRGLRT